MAESPASDGAFAFDSFKVLPRERALYEGESAQIRIGGCCSRVGQCASMCAAPGGRRR